MKEITGEIRLEEFEVPTLKSEPKRVRYKVRVNAYSKEVKQLNDYKKMTFVIDGELYSADLAGYHIGNEEYFVSPFYDFDKKPKNIKLYRYG